MSIVGHLWRPHDFTGRRLTAEDFAREARYLLDGARRHHRFPHGRVVASGLPVRRREYGAPVGAGMAIDCEGDEILAPAAMRDGITGEAPPQVAALLHKEAEVLPVPSPSNDTMAPSIRQAAKLMILEIDPSHGGRRMGPGTPGCGDAHPIGLAVRSAGRQGWRPQRARGASSPAPMGAR